MKKNIRTTLSGWLRRVLPLCLLTLLPLGASAQQQELKFGYLSYETALKAMPDYAAVQYSIDQLREQYAAEQKRVEDDFNKKYEEFLDGQANFPKTILQKRQSELQEMLSRNIAFKEQSQRLLAEAETEAKAPLVTHLAEVLERIGLERGYAFILNTDQQATLFINPQQGEDITEVVTKQLNN